MGKCIPAVAFEMPISLFSVIHLRNVSQILVCARRVGGKSITQFYLRNFSESGPRNHRTRQRHLGAPLFAFSFRESVIYFVLFPNSRLGKEPAKRGSLVWGVYF